VFRSCAPNSVASETTQDGGKRESLKRAWGGDRGSRSAHGFDPTVSRNRREVRQGIAERIARCFPNRRDPPRITHRLAEMVRAPILATACQLTGRPSSGGRFANLQFATTRPWRSSGGASRCYSARGPNADRHRNALCWLVVTGSGLGAELQTQDRRHNPEPHGVHWSAPITKRSSTTVAASLRKLTDCNQGPNQGHKCQESGQRPTRVPGRKRVEFAREERFVVRRVPQAQLCIGKTNSSHPARLFQ